ncbi:uncharacterized protein YpmB [Salirhabdus euzebyi]|uniref:Uncharacterized protein YpmB n=1 Tax=Salirhabdus euzebyi TaxID=394506 RepID=A0A841PXN1_9BACI|nr:DUF5590 domain-containing protein [Salirhabdus euzebyi]MBB6452236.1 uncharacterized protein YpmB [Salirhabdus euzebyi]
MKRQQYSLSTRRKVFIWISIGTLLLLLFAFIYFFTVYQTAMDTKQETFASSETRAIQQTPLVKVTDTKRFNGEAAYDIVYGQTKENEPGYAFIPLQDDIEIIFTLEEEGLSENEMVSKWKADCADCDLMSVVPGIDKGRLLWEIIYKNNQGRIVYEYYLYSNGNLYEQFKFKTEEEELK